MLMLPLPEILTLDVKAIVAFFLLLISVYIAPSSSTQSSLSSETLVVYPPQVMLSGGLYDAYSLEQHPLSVNIIVQNTSNETTHYLIAIEIRKLSDGVTVLLDLQSAVTAANEDEYIYAAWTPEEAGTYQVRTFLISDLALPQILSSVKSSETYIYDNSFRGLIKMKKSGCDGECPAYYVEVYNNRTAIFEGYDYLAKPGRYVFEVSQDQTDQLVDAIYNADFFSSEGNCLFLEEDDGAPSIEFTVNVLGNWKQVIHHREDCVPDRLIQFEMKVDEILDTKKWVYGGYPYVKIDKLYVAHLNSEFENIKNDTIKVGERYSVTAEISRLGNNAGIEGALKYVLVIQIKDEEGLVNDSTWQSGTLPFGESTSGGIYWMPTTPGSYTIDSLVLQSLRGTPLGEKQTIHVTVI